MSLFVFKDNYLEFFGTKYFVDNAPLQTLGAYGEKAGGILSTGKLEPKDHLPVPKFKGKVKAIGPIALDAKTSSKADFNESVSASIKIVGLTTSQGSTYTALETQKLKLVQLWIEPNDVQRWANDSPKALSNLRDQGGDARVVHTVFLIMEASFASSFAGAASWALGVDAAGIVSVTANGGSSVSGKNRVTLAAGTVLSYGMLKLDWSKGKEDIEDTDVDEVGLK